jgi:proton-coupled amino acid transporter
MSNQAGEDLEELEEDEDEEEPIDEDRRAYDQPSGSQDTGPEAAQGSLARILAESQPSKSAVSETSPLLPRARASSLQRSRTRRRRATVSHGDATVGQAILMVCHD